MATFKIIIDKRHKPENDKYHLTLRVSNKQEVLYLRLGALMTVKEYEKHFVKKSYDKEVEKVKSKFDKCVDELKKFFQVLTHSTQQSLERNTSTLVLILTILSQKNKRREVQSSTFSKTI